jgi:hypothetical protein
VIPPKLREDVLKSVHDDVTAGHMGFRRTFKRLKKKYYWDKMGPDVKKYVDSCIICSRATVSRLAPAGLLIPIKPSERPFAKVGFDKMGKIHATTRENDCIFTLTDYCTKTVVAMAAPDGRAEQAVKLMSQVIVTYGPPYEVITDNGREFDNYAFKELCDSFGVKHLKTTARHPQTNGQTERFNDTLSTILRKYVNAHQTDWDLYLPYAIFAYNTAEHEATGFSPYFLLYGIEPPLNPTDRRWMPDFVPPQHDFSNLTVLKEVRAYAATLVQHKHDMEKERYDMGRRQPVFEKGDLVMVRVPQNVSGGGLSARFRSPYIGPFVVVGMTGPNTVRIETSIRNMKAIINLDKLKRYYARQSLVNDSDTESTLISHHEDQNDNTLTPTAGQDQSARSDGVLVPVHNNFNQEEPDRDEEPDVIQNDAQVEKRTRSGRVTRPPQRLLTACPILEDGGFLETGTWCLTIFEEYERTAGSGSRRPTEIKFEMMNQTGYHAHVISPTSDTGLMFKEIGDAAGSDVIQQVEEAVKEKQFRRTTQQCVDGIMHSIKGRLQDTDTGVAHQQSSSGMGEGQGDGIRHRHQLAE